MNIKQSLLAVGIITLSGCSLLGTTPSSEQPTSQDLQEQTEDLSEQSGFSTSDEPETVNANQDGVTVSYTNTGFEPSELTVEAGATVTFSNDSGTSMWVASDIHPTHELLPGFDQGESGQEYSFTFDEVGEWTYHNHLRPSATGTIVVQ